MLQDQLTKSVLRRLQELGLPQSVLDVGDFRERFLLRHWVMLVRDGDAEADVHLIQPALQRKATRFETNPEAKPRQSR